jgi:hypothetical protein
MKSAREIAEHIAYVFNDYTDYDAESAEEFVVEVTSIIEDYVKDIKGEKCKKKQKE